MYTNVNHVKINIMKPKERQKVFQTIVNKAWEDDAFKRKLILSPVSVIEGLIGERLKLSKDKTIVVSDQTDESVVYINIPAKVSMDDMELTEEQLEIIAGGGTPVIIDPAAPITDPSIVLDNIIEE